MSSFKVTRSKKRPSWFFLHKHLVSNELIWNIRWLPIVQIMQVCNEGSMAYIWLNLNWILLLPLSSSAHTTAEYHFLTTWAMLQSSSLAHHLNVHFIITCVFLKKWTKAASLFSDKLPFIQSSLYKLYVLLLFFYVYNFNDGKRNWREQLYSSVTLQPEAYT